MAGEMLTGDKGGGSQWGTDKKNQRSEVGNGGGEKGHHVLLSLDSFDFDLKLLPHQGEGKESHFSGQQTKGVPKSQGQAGLMMPPSSQQSDLCQTLK